jgi:hypothetical protein
MAAAFFKINVEFSIKDDKSDSENESILSQYIPEVSDGIVLNYMFPDGRTISYTAYKVEIDNGDLVVEKKGENLFVKCAAVFKKTVKPELFESVNNNEGKWYSSGLTGVYGIIEGLKEEKYKYKNRNGEGEAVRYLISVEISSKKIKL